MSSATPPSIPLLHGRYRIEQKLGTGRLAVVYRAFDERLQRLVLVHMLRKELVSQEPLRQRFIEESHASARRSHQSLLEVFDSGDVAGRPYMITEYVAGRTLRDLGALSPEEALLYVRQVVGAVAACQVAGVPHPPISSTNLILVDDGHVEMVESWLTTPASVPLDLACYRAPERTVGQPATHASAVYAIGLLLFELLTGQRPITGSDPRVVAQAHLTAQIPALHTVRPQLYLPSLEQLLQRTTARQPELRPTDALALSQELDGVRRTISDDTQRLAAPPVRPPSFGQRLKGTASEFVTRRPVPRPLPDPALPLPDPDTNPAMTPARRTPAPGRSWQRIFGGGAVLLVLFAVV